MMACLSSNDALAAAEAAGGAEVVEMIRASLPPELAHIDRDVQREIAADDLAHESQHELPRQAALGNLERVRELLAVEGVELDGFDAFYRTALSAAAEAGRHEMVRELAALGADVDKSNAVVGSPRSTPLACAAISSSAERDGILRLLLEAGADPDKIGADGRTALMHAVERDVGFFGRTGAPALSTRTLIAAGADLEIRDPYGLTAWMRAKSLASSIALDEIAEQYEAIAALLEEAGASTAGRPEVELIRAVTAGDVDEVRDLLAAGVDPNARRHDGATALILAVRDAARDVVRLLIDAGCDLGAREWVERGRTALETADDNEERRIVRILTEAGAGSAEGEGAGG
jgi:ankyrin repeat protein